jgi:hypothetical protein
MRAFIQTVVIAILPAMICAQQQVTPSLIRYLKNDSAIRIPFTQFCIVEETGFSTKYSSGWVMDWDVAPKHGHMMLFIEMNSTEVEGWFGNDDISGSFQFAIELTSLSDSLSLSLDGTPVQKFNYVNNYGGGDAISNKIRGTIKLVKKEKNIYISAALKLTTRNPVTKQEIGLSTVSIPLYTLTSFGQLMKEKNIKMEKERDAFADAMVAAINIRDSIWDEADKKNADLPREPFRGSFRFWISDVNKAGYNRTTYFITEDSLVIKEGPYDFIYFAKNYAADSVFIARAIPAGRKQSFNDIGRQIKKDSLESTYTNFCIMDGLILHFQFEWPDTEKSTTISNYYLKEIEDVIQFVNTIVPKKYQLNYPKEELVKMQKACK